MAKNVFLSTGLEKIDNFAILKGFWSQQIFLKNIIFKGKNIWKTRFCRQKIFLTPKNLLKWQKTCFLSPSFEKIAIFASLKGFLESTNFFLKKLFLEVKMS
jgi:hypothetical protein